MRSILRTVVLIILFFLCGFLIGKVLLTYSLNDFLTGKNKYALFVSRPMYNFLNLYNNLNSTNEYNRLRAYYWLKSYKILPIRFLKDRIAIEQNIVIKRTIIWMLRYAKNTNEAKQLLQQLKNNSNMPIFKDIDSSLQFLNKK